MTQQRLKLGARGEQLACDHLVAAGFRILDRNYRSGRGELDIVAFDGARIVFVEVKTKSRTGAELNPMFSIGPRKRLQVRRIASRWLSERQDRPYARELRCDAIGVVLSPDGELLKLEHIPGAF